MIQENIQMELFFLTVQFQQVHCLLKESFHNVVFPHDYSTFVKKKGRGKEISACRQPMRKSKKSPGFIHPSFMHFIKVHNKMNFRQESDNMYTLQSVFVSI